MEFIRRILFLVDIKKAFNNSQSFLVKNLGGTELDAISLRAAHALHTHTYTLTHNAISFQVRHKPSMSVITTVISHCFGTTSQANS